VLAGFAAAGHFEKANAPLVLKVGDEGPSRTGFAPVVKKVLPTVVNIASTKVSKIPTGFEGGVPDDLFRQFFGDSNRRHNTPAKRPNSGSRGLAQASL